MTQMYNKRAYEEQLMKFESEPEVGIVYLDIEVKTGLFSYSVGGRCGLMDANCRRLTDPLYSRIIAVDKNMYRALLLDSYSEVILNGRGEVMK